MQYGLALSFHNSVYSAENSDIFFTAIAQLNYGGPDEPHDPEQRSKIAGLNLKAGRLSIILSDYTSAFKFFKHGISYLDEDHWSTHYYLSVNLYDAAAEAACALEKNEAVKFYTEEVVKNATCLDDSLNCEYFVDLAQYDLSKLVLTLYL